MEVGWVPPISRGDSMGVRYGEKRHFAPEAREGDAVRETRRERIDGGGFLNAAARARQAIGAGGASRGGDKARRRRLAGAEPRRGASVSEAGTRRPRAERHAREWMSANASPGERTCGGMAGVSRSLARRAATMRRAPWELRPQRWRSVAGARSAPRLRCVRRHTGERRRASPEWRRGRARASEG